MSRRYTLFAVVLPVLVIAFVIARAELSGRNGKEYVFEIEGYDPRDLLRGHYLQFRIRVDPLSEREPCGENDDCCVCLTGPPDEIVEHAETVPCDTTEACDAKLRTRYLHEPQRYYVAERRAPEYERRLREMDGQGRAVALLALNREGEARVLELRFDGEPIR
jgi:uncharacterized membrane-anchored protein